MKPEVFFEDLRQDVLVRADASEEFTEVAFAEVVTEHLLEAGSIEDFQPCSYIHRGIRIDGYSYQPEEGLLELFAIDYRQGDSPETMSRAEMDQAFRRAEAFFEKSLREKFVSGMETSHPAFALARMILDRGEQIVLVRFYLLTNAVLTGTVKELPSRSVGNREWSYRVWDLSRLTKTVGMGLPEEIVINFVEMFGEPLTCLPAGDHDSNVRCFLAVIPGRWLAQIYDQYRGRLLEQNVRTFLQVRGKVNKGIRKTILEEPTRFFPYNNGISATAEEVVEVRVGGVSNVTTIRNLQIVNGGQTTASIYNAMKKDRDAPIEKIFVQMKLSVVDPRQSAELVPKISRFANSQNRVSDSDFFSNHEFHGTIEKFSRNLAAPARDGSQILTYWFYERAKGQYANGMAYLSAAKKKAYQLQYPRNQVISKTELAKYVQTFRELPHEVSAGGEKNFGRFAEQVSGSWEKTRHDYNEFWFKRAIAEAIIFKALEKDVQKADWYAQGYRANTVTYGVALFMNRIRKLGYELDIQRIWREQGIGKVLMNELMACCRVVQDELIAGAPRNGVSNVTEWCKRKSCWDEVLALPYQPSREVFDVLRYLEDDRAERRDARTDSKETSSVQAQVAVVSAGADFWKEVRNWALDTGELPPSDIRRLDAATAIPRKIPRDKDCVRLQEIRAMFESKA